MTKPFSPALLLASALGALTALPVPAQTTAAPAPTARPAPAPISVGPREADFIVAVVNTEPVTNNEVRARIARAQRQMAERGLSAPPSEQLRKEMLERLISERAQLQYAREQGLKVDDAALAQALRAGRIAAAGLDVFEGEPRVHPDLLACTNVALTPHIASASIPTRLAMANLAADNLIGYLTQGRALTPLNPEVMER